MLRRDEAVTMDTLISQYIRDMELASGLNGQRASEAWDKASKAGKYTLSRSLRDGKLYVRLSSSAVRSQLYMQKEALIEEINRILAEDSLFSVEKGEVPVKDIIML